MREETVLDTQYISIHSTHSWQRDRYSLQSDPLSIPQHKRITRWQSYINQGRWVQSHSG